MTDFSDFPINELFDDLFATMQDIRTCAALIKYGYGSAEVRERLEGNIKIKEVILAEMKSRNVYCLFMDDDTTEKSYVVVDQSLTKDQWYEIERLVSEPLGNFKPWAEYFVFTPLDQEPLILYLEQAGIRYQVKND